MSKVSAYPPNYASDEISPYVTNTGEFYSDLCDLARSAESSNIQRWLSLVNSHVDAYRRDIDPSAKFSYRARMAAAIELRDYYINYVNEL